MEKEKSTRIQTARKRLLIFLGLLLFFPLTILFPDEAYALFLLTNTIQKGAPFKIGIRISKQFTIYKIDADSDFLIENLPKSAERIAVDSMTGAKGKEITYTYVFHSAGEFTIGPVFIKSKTKQFKVSDPFSLTVTAPPLSTQTQFTWIIEAENSTHSNTEKIIQGKTYPLFLCGEFNNAESAKKGVRIKSVYCPAPENAVVSKNDEFISKEKNEYLYIAAEFTWTPITSGEISLPFATIMLSDGMEIKTQPQTIQVHPNAKFTQEASATHESFTESAFIKPAQEPLPKKRAQADTAPLIKKLSQLRKQQRNSFFTYTLQKQQKEIEAKLGIEKSFPVHSLPKLTLFFSAFVILFIAAIIFHLVKMKNQKRVFLVLFVFFSIFFVLISFHILSRASIFKETALCRSIENQNPLIYTVPETSASVIAEPMEGETLIIEKKAGLWYYVKTINNTYGWIQKDFLLFYHNK